MSYPNEGKVVTVNGPVDPEALGVTLSHEHVLVDLSVYAAEPRSEHQKRVAGRPLSIESLGEARREPGIVADNMLLDDIDAAVEELGEFANEGGRSVIDVSPVGIRGDVRRIREWASGPT